MVDGARHDEPTPAPDGSAPAGPAPLADFAAAAGATLEHLHRRFGMDSWAVARRDGPDYVVLAALETGRGGPVAGDVLAWRDTFCAAVAAGQAPRFSTRVEHVPGWAHARRATGFPWRSYLSVPLVGPDGSVLGTLCAGAHEPVDADAEEALADVELAAGLLGTLLAYEVRLQQEARRAERAEAAAHRDALTGAGNRHAWDAALAVEEARANALGSTASVLVLDLDALKETNDTHGHDAGDALLVRTARVLREQLREVDLVVRLGGDEFAALLPDVDATAAAGLTARLEEALHGAGVRASLGVATRRAATGLEEAWHRADAAMYAVKAGRTRTVGAPGGAERPSTPVGAGGGPGAAERTVEGLTCLDEAVLAERVHHLLQAARQQLRVDLTVLAEFDGGTWRLRRSATAAGVPDPTGFACALADTYCGRLVGGTLRAVITDTRADPVTAALPVTEALDIGAYAAAPVHLADGTLYGTVCAISRTAQPDLRPRDAGVLELLAQTLSAPLSAQHRKAGRRREVLSRLAELARDGGPRPVYQPVVDLRTGAAVGVEALSRFPPGDPAEAGEHGGDGSGGGPEVWFARAAQAGVGTQLELSALRAALRQRPGGGGRCSSTSGPPWPPPRRWPGPCTGSRSPRSSWRSPSTSRSTTTPRCCATSPRCAGRVCGWPSTTPGPGSPACATSWRCTRSS